MSRTLNPQTICNLYTLDEISAKVATYQDALESAIVKSYDKDTTQGRQKVESADMDKIESILSVWMKAYELKQGLGNVRVVSHNFGGHH